VINAVSTNAREPGGVNDVTGNTLKATPIKTVITVVGTRLPDRRTLPLICGSARKSNGDSRCQPVTISIIAGASRLHCYRWVSIQRDAEQVTRKKRKSAVRTGITSLAAVLANVSLMLTTAIICAGAAGADPSQQQDQFVALLQQEQIPAVDNIPGLVARAHEICGELDGGAPVETVVGEEINSAYADNPVLHLYPARVRRTATRFITASVDVYCPSHQGQLP
jgi:hypothetical protein